MILFRKELFFLKLDVKNTCERHKGYLIFTFTPVFFHLWLYEYDYKINWILQGNSKYFHKLLSSEHGLYIGT